MATFFRLLLGYMWDCFRSHERLKAEILILRHQLNILHRKAPKRLRLSGGDRALFVWLYRRFPDIGNAAAIVRPETIIRWHRMGFRAWWRWKSHNPGGRPGIDQEPRDLVHSMCKENPLWGAPRIHGELLKLGIVASSRSIRRYRWRGPGRAPTQTWRTFLQNHLADLVSVDFFVVPTATFRVLYVFVVAGDGSIVVQSERCSRNEPDFRLRALHLRQHRTPLRQIFRKRILRRLTEWHDALRLSLPQHDDECFVHAHRVGLAGVCEHRAVVVDVARPVQETNAFGRADRVGEPVDDVAAPAFAHVRNALDEPRHRGEASVIAR